MLPLACLHTYWCRCLFQDPVLFWEHQLGGYLIPQCMHNVLMPVIPALALPQPALQQEAVGLQLRIQLGQACLSFAQLLTVHLALQPCCRLTGLQDKMTSCVWGARRRPKSEPF